VDTVADNPLEAADKEASNKPETANKEAANQRLMLKWLRI
jgi:hypothetical protein